MTGESNLAADPVVTQWAAHWGRTRRLAAVLASELASCPDNSRVEASARTAARHGVSYAVAVNARNMLVGAGFAYKHGSHYYKAPARNGTST